MKVEEQKPCLLPHFFTIPGQFLYSVAAFPIVPTIAEPSFFRLLTWPEDQWLPGNLPGLQHQAGMVEASCFVDRIAAGFPPG